MTGKLTDWVVGSSDIENHIDKAHTLIEQLGDALSGSGALIETFAVEQITAAIEQIFAPEPDDAESVFELHDGGLRADLFEGDLSFVIPWEKLAAPFDRPELLTLKTAFDAWFEEKMKDCAEQEQLERDLRERMPKWKTDE